MDAETRKCAVCLIRSENFADWLIAVSRPETPSAVAIGPIESFVNPTASVEFLCGEACAHARLSRALAAPRTKETL